MWRSIVELANEKIEDDKVDDFVNGLLDRANISHRKHITFSNFQQIIKDYRDDLSLISLDVQRKMNTTFSDRWSLTYWASELTIITIVIMFI